MSLFSRRPRFQLSLRTLFVLFLLACILIGLGIKWRQRALIQQSVIRELQAKNWIGAMPEVVECKYDFQQIDDPVQQRLFIPKPSWLSWLLGIDMIHSVKEVDFHRAANRADFELLNQLGNLKVVRLWSSVSRVEDFEALYTLGNLSQLTINAHLNLIEGVFPWLNDDRFKQIGKLSNLKELHLLRPVLHDVEWDSVLQHPTLETLTISGLSKPIPSFNSNRVFGSSIEKLYLSGNESNETSIRHLLSRTKNLEFLSLEQSMKNKAEITDAFFESISKLEKLETLFLHGTNIKGHELHRLEKLPMKKLGLGFSNLDDTGLEKLFVFKSLSYLEVGSTNISDEGMKSLTQLPELKYLSIRDTKVSDKGFLELAKIKGLKTIRIRDTLITDEGVQKFRKLLPECAIDVR